MAGAIYLFLTFITTLTSNRLERNNPARVAYGVTETHVYRRLALTRLPYPVIDALRSGEIGLSNAAAFTISDDEKRPLEVIENVRCAGESDHSIKKMLKSEAIKGRDRRIDKRTPSLPAC